MQISRNGKIAVATLSDFFLFVAMTALLFLDKIVNGMLYNYDLRYSFEWFYFYKIYWSIAVILIAVLIFVIPLLIMTELEE